LRGKIYKKLKIEAVLRGPGMLYCYSISAKKWQFMRQIFVLPFALWAFGVTPSLAEEQAAAGLPQLNVAVFLPQIFWLILVFVLLYLCLSRLALPKIADVLASRQQKISTELDKAEAMSLEALKVGQEIDARLAQARQEAGQMTSQAQAEAMGEITRRQTAFLAKLAQNAAESEERITAAKQQAERELEAVAAQLAQDLVQKIAAISLTNATAQQAIEKLKQ
jgi:F-type H+-transporting ATPase subunit b